MNQKTITMPPTFTQLHIHLVFAVKGRQNLIPKTHLDQLEPYITGIVQELGHKLIHIKCMPDHSHLFVGWKLHHSLAELVSKTKTAASVYIKKQPWGLPFFSWQIGYGAFSYSLAHVDSFVKYLVNQEAYHRTHTFQEEYLGMLQKFDVPYDERYLFEFYDILS